MLKYEIDTLDQVEEANRSHYAAHPAGAGFVLQVEGADGLKSALNKERETRREATERVKALEIELQQMTEGARAAAQEHARNSTDISAVEAGWKTKHEGELRAKDEELASLKNEYQPRIDKLNAQVQAVLFDREAVRIASEIAMPGAASLLLPHIRQRLSVEERAGELVTVAKDKTGKSIDLTEFKTQFCREAEFAPVLVGSKASGSGAVGSPRGSAPTAKTLTRAQYDALSVPDRSAFHAGGGTVL